MLLQTGVLHHRTLIKLRLQVVEVSARYDDQCISGLTNFDRDRSLVQVGCECSDLPALCHADFAACCVCSWEVLGPCAMSL